LIPTSAVTCEFAIFHRCRGVEKPLSTRWHSCLCAPVWYGD